jgi:hypothetical protein
VKSGRRGLRGMQDRILREVGASRRDARTPRRGIPTSRTKNSVLHQLREQIDYELAMGCPTLEHGNGRCFGQAAAARGKSIICGYAELT